MENDENGIDEHEEAQNRRPMPVRAAMESTESPEEDPGADTREFQDPGSGEDWIARISGRSMSGVVPLRIIPLIEVGFYKAQAPSILVRRALCQGESLEQVDDGGLLSLFKISELHVPPGQENPPPEARDRKDRRRRRP